MIEVFIMLNPVATGAINIVDLVRERTADTTIQFANEDTGTSASELILNSCGDDEGCFHVQIPYTEWTKPLENEFVRLAKQAALLRITNDQASRLEELRSSRRRLKNRRTPDEIAWEHKQRKATRELLLALKQYAQLHDPTNSPWARAKENIH